MLKPLHTRHSIMQPILYMVLIFILSSIPFSKSGGHTLLRRALQNLLHIPLFGLLGYLWVRTFLKKAMESKKAFFYALLISIPYGAIDEIHQYFVPGRCCAFSDFLFDSFGCALFLWIYWLTRRELVANASPVIASKAKQSISQTRGRRP